MAAQLPHISCSRSTPQESLFEFAATTQTQARRQNGGPRCEYVDMENVFACHSTSRSSSWKRLFGECTCNHNQPQRKVKQLFDVTRTLVRNQKEIHGISLIDRQDTSWKRTTLLIDRAVQLSTAKACVFSESELCMGRIREKPVKAWRDKIDCLMNFRPNVANWIGNVPDHLQLNK